MQLIANVEKEELGITGELYVMCGNIKNPEEGYLTIGYYDDNMRKIVLNMEILDENSSAQEAVSCTIHECFHCYQRCLVAYYNSIDDKPFKIYKDKQIRRHPPLQIPVKYATIFPDKLR